MCDRRTRAGTTSGDAIVSSRERGDLSSSYPGEWPKHLRSSVAPYLSGQQQRHQARHLRTPHQDLESSSQILQIPSAAYII